MKGCSGTMDQRTGTEWPAASMKRKLSRLLKTDWAKPAATGRWSMMAMARWLSGWAAKNAFIFAGSG